VNVGEVAASSAGDENLAAGLRVAFEESHAATTLSGHGGAHEAGGARTEDKDIEAAQSRRSSFDRLRHSSILSETYGIEWSSKRKDEFWPDREVRPGPKFFLSKGGLMSSVVTNPRTPPFTRETATAKVRAAEDAWNTRDPERVSLAYSIDSRWRNRSEFINGREEIVAFLTRKWARELGYRLIKELWTFGDARIAVRFAYESHDAAGQWFRSYGNENWEFGADGLMHRRYASINDLPIDESERLFHWPDGRRPDDHPTLSELGL
jgi:uncharacterized protein